MTQQGEGSGSAGGGGSGRGEKRMREFWLLPDSEDEPPRPPDQPGCEDIFKQTVQRDELSKSWQRAIDLAAAGERSDYTAPADVTRESHHVQNQPGHVHDRPSSSNTVIFIDDSDEDGNDDILWMGVHAQPTGAQPKNTWTNSADQPGSSEM